MKEIRSYTEWKTLSDNIDTAYLLFYKQHGSPVNRCALDNLNQAIERVNGITMYAVNVEETRDIHPNYPINSVPVLVEFQKGVLKNTLKGCHDTSFYINHFENRMTDSSAEKEGRPAYQVTVYSTPTCSWCSTLKNYLRKNQIRFTDVDVSRDMEAAREMVNRSGQQGVPQSIINGEVVVGFNKARIDQLLGTR